VFFKHLIADLQLPILCQNLRVFLEVSLSQLEGCRGAELVRMHTALEDVLYLLLRHDVYFRLEDLSHSVRLNL
jgi:hypothetical protein